MVLCNSTKTSYNKEDEGTICFFNIKNATCTSMQLLGSMRIVAGIFKDGVKLLALKYGQIIRTYYCPEALKFI